MVRLSNTLVRRRLFYNRPIDTTPDLVVLDIAPPFASPSLPLGRYYVVIVETSDELAELNAFLEQERTALVPPDLLDQRPSRRATAHVTLCRYGPPRPGWPEILLCHWPAEQIALVESPGENFARAAYTLELFPSLAALADSAAKLIEAFGDSTPVSVTMIAGEHLPAAGHA